MIYATYLGGDMSDQGNGIGADDDGNAIIAGWTASSDFPLMNPLQQTFGESKTDGIIARLDLLERSPFSPIIWRH
ncbi:MAG: SBBP repeat-containing protein [Verrucomicrobiales bacterium]